MADQYDRIDEAIQPWDIDVHSEDAPPTDRNSTDSFGAFPMLSERLGYAFYRCVLYIASILRFY